MQPTLHCENLRVRFSAEKKAVFLGREIFRLPGHWVADVAETSTPHEYEVTFYAGVIMKNMKYLLGKIDGIKIIR